MSLESPYQQFVIEKRLSFSEGKGGLPFIEIDNEYATAVISIYGAQVLSYTPKSTSVSHIGAQNKDMLFTSDLAYFEHGKAIKGGIPICWPLFGKDQEDPDRQMHGFARNMLWQLDETSMLSTGDTQVILSLSDSEETHQHWTHDFKLILTVTIGKALHLSLTTVNTGKTKFKLTQALHAYFSIDDIAKTEVNGLDNVMYLDKVTHAIEPQLQKGNIRVNQEVDRIYVDAPSELTLLDKRVEREVVIKSSGSKTAVVWNPWKEISRNSADLTDDAYLQFICIETANAAEDYVVIEPNQSSTIEAEYSVS